MIAQFRDIYSTFNLEWFFPAQIHDVLYSDLCIALCEHLNDLCNVLFISFLKYLKW